MGELVIITGIPGTGKTTVLEETLKHSSGWEIVTYGTVMFDIAKERKLVEHRDELRKLPQEQQKQLQELAADAIAAMAYTKKILLDTHATIKTPRGYLPAIKKSLLEKASPSLIVNVEATPKDIYGRRHSDETRARDSESEEQIDAHQRLNRAFSASYCAISGATMAIVMNHDNKLSAAVEQMAALLKTK